MKFNKKQRRLPKGYNVIELKTKFSTENLPLSVGKKAAWASGVVVLSRNPFRGISEDFIEFSSPKEYILKIRELLKRNKISLINLPESRRLKKARLG